jgi:Xaa-Pro aminopeptidase
VVLPADGAASLVVESQDWRRDLVECDAVRDSHDLYGEVARTLVDAGLAGKRLGLIGGAVLPLRGWERIDEATPDTAWEPADSLLQALRMRKSPAEIAMMRHANAVGAAIQVAMLSAAEPGRTDADLVRRGLDVCLEHGAVPFEFAFASGPHAGHVYWSRLPAWDRTRPYERGDIIHPDAYGCVDGYFYDVHRSLVVGGDPTPEQRRLLDGAVDCVHALCAACRPGVPVADIARLRGDWLAANGFADDANEAAPEEFLRQLEACGHGVGVGFELPWVDGRETELLEPGMTIALEVFLSAAGAGTAAFEEVVLVTDGEPEIITADCPARWW